MSSAWMLSLTDTTILYLLRLPQILLQENFLMEWVSLEHLPRTAFFSAYNQYPGLWSLIDRPPEYLIPFSPTTQLLLLIQVTTNSLLRCSSSLLTGILVSSLVLLIHPLTVRMRLLAHRFYLVTNFLFKFLQWLSIVQRTKCKLLKFANKAWLCP